MVALPITNDQPGVAARIANKKVGVVISPHQASPENFVTAIRRVLGDSTFRDNVQKVQEQSAARKVFLLPPVFWKKHLSWRGGNRGRPKIASLCARIGADNPAIISGLVRRRPTDSLRLS
jgi:hypothetical protein